MASSKLSRAGRTAVALSVILSISLTFVLYNTRGMETIMAFIPAIACIPLTAYVLSTRRKDNVEVKRLVNESPAVIGMMAVRIGSGGSLDTAARDVALTGPRCSSKLFGKVVNDADLRMCPDVRKGLEMSIHSLPSSASSFKRSVQMIMAASIHKDENEKRRMINDAQDLSLRGVREIGESYSSSVSNPCMMVFGLGVMVPMILMSIMPMLNMGGVFSVPFLNETAISFITLAIIPGIVSIVVFSVIKSNPFRNVQMRKNNVWVMIPFLSAIPLFVITSFVTEDLGCRIVISFAAAGIICAAMLFPKVSADKKRRVAAASLEHVLFETGNRMISGENFETAFVDSLSERKECRMVERTLRTNILFSKGDIADGVRSSLHGYSEAMGDAYVRIYRSSVKNVRDAGRLAVSLGHQMQDQTAARKKTENKLKSMSDMMTVTSVMFAPLIMGLSIVLLKPLSEVAGASDGTDMFVVLLIYLIELAALVSVLTVYMGSNGSAMNAAYRFAIILPVSLMVFMIFSGLSL